MEYVTPKDLNIYLHADCVTFTRINSFGENFQ
jgi:hypothetical protein